MRQRGDVAEVIFKLWQRGGSDVRLVVPENASIPEAAITVDFKVSTGNAFQFFGGWLLLPFSAFAFTFAFPFV